MTSSKRQRASDLASISLSGNKGGSYITITEDQPGMLHLEVGETCVVTVDQCISVAGLAAVLTWCKDRGFQSIVDEYLALGGGQPTISVERDFALPEDGCG